MVTLSKRERLEKVLFAVVLVGVIYGAIMILNAVGIVGSYYLQILSLVAINIVLVVSLNLVNGFTGQLSLGHAGFLAIGAYSSAYLTARMDVPFLPAIFGGALLAAVMGVVMGLPTLRLRGDYLAIATLGMCEVIRVMINNIDAVGGARGFAGIPKYTDFSVAFFFAVLTIVVIRNLVYSDHGRALIAIREDEIAADAMGINVTFYKVAAFTISAFFAGLAGGLFAHYMQYMSPQQSQIGFLRSIEILIMVVLGGLGSITGSVLAAILLTVLPEVLRFFSEYRMIIYPLVLLLIMLYRPQGLMGNKEWGLDTVKSIFRRNKFPRMKEGVEKNGAS